MKRWTPFSLKGIGSIAFQINVGIDILLLKLEAYPELKGQKERLKNIAMLVNEVRVTLVQNSSLSSLTEDEIELIFKESDAKLNAVRSVELRAILDEIQKEISIHNDVQKAINDLRAFLT